MAKYNRSYNQTYGKKYTLGDLYRFDSEFEKEVNDFISDNAVKFKLKDVQLQPQYTLIEQFTTNMGRKIKKRIYTPDFKLVLYNGKILIIEAKGFARADYMLREAIFLNMLNEDENYSNYYFYRVDMSIISKAKWNSKYKGKCKYKSRRSLNNYYWKASLYIVVMLLSSGFSGDMEKEVKKKIDKEILI